MFAAISVIASFPHFICALYSVALHESNTHIGMREWRNKGIKVRKRKTKAESSVKEREMALNTCKLTLCCVQYICQIAQ